MSLDRTDLERAVEHGILSGEQARALWSLIDAPAPPSAPAQPLVAGASCALAVAAALAIAILPLTAWERYAGPGLALAGTAYAALFVGVGARLWRGRHAAAGGVLVAAGALMVPFAVHGLEHWLRFFPNHRLPQDLGDLLRSHEFPTDVAAIAALALALWRVRFPPLCALLAGAGWILAMDAAPLAFGEAPTWSQRALLSALLGLFVIAAAFVLDRRTRADFSRWLYLAGLVALCGGLTTFRTASDATVLLHAGMDVALVTIALLVRRRMFAVFGALGLAGAAGHLADDFLDGSALFAVAVAVALATVAGAMLYARIENRLARPLRAAFPPVLRRLLPPIPET